MCANHLETSQRQHTNTSKKLPQENPDRRCPQWPPNVPKSFQNLPREHQTASKKLPKEGPGDSKRLPGPPQEGSKKYVGKVHRFCHRFDTNLEAQGNQKSTKNVKKRAPETGPGKDAETAAKRRACNPQKQWFGIGGVAKITKPRGLRKVTKMTPKRLPKWSQIEQKALPEPSQKTHRKRVAKR